MKNILMLTLLFVIVTSSITSCKKEDTSPEAVVNSLQDGTWRITDYKDDMVDELYHFTGYSFVFSNGTVTATKNSLSVTGTYSEGTDDTYPVLILNFGTTSPFDELNDDWHILEQSATKIRLEDVSGGNGGTDILTFEKN